MRQTFPGVTEAGRFGRRINAAATAATAAHDDDDGWWRTCIIYTLKKKPTIACMAWRSETRKDFVLQRWPVSGVLGDMLAWVATNICGKVVQG